MPNLATWLKPDSKPVSAADRRLANRFLSYWEKLRGHRDFPLITDLNFEDMGAFAPYSFNLDLCADPRDPRFRFIGRELMRDCGGDLTNQGISRLLPKSILARAVQQRGEVIGDGKPCMVADAFTDGDGRRVLYRAVMLPFSSTGAEVDFIIGAISSKTEGEAEPSGAERAEAAPVQIPEEARETLQDLPHNRLARQERKEVSELIAEVSAATCAQAPAAGGRGESAAKPADPRTGGGAARGRIIVVGSEKGGTGKSTTAMHLVAALLYDGHRVGYVDLDSPQSSLNRYIENRRALNRQHGLSLPLPEDVGSAAPGQGTGLLEEDLARLAGRCDFVVVDTPGSDSAISRMAHSWANIVITPINDSFVDLDTLAVLDAEGEEIVSRGHYADMVAQARKQKVARTGEGFDWIVLRNRLSNLEARNKNRMADALQTLAGYLDFRNCPGLSERVIYRELFLQGLTLLDLRKERAGVSLSMSHVAARQELRALVRSIGIAKAADAKQSEVAGG